MDETTVKEDKNARELRLAQENWEAYLRGRDGGHTKYVASAKKFDAYYRGDQWDPATERTLDAEGRPHQTVNMVLSTINAVLGQQISTRQDIDFAPRARGATEDTALVLGQLVKQIQDNNKSKWVEGTVFADGLIEERGFFDIRIDFSDNIFGEIRETALNPREVILDPGANEYDPSTWAEVIHTRWLTVDEISGLYGEDKAKELRNGARNNTLGYDSADYDQQIFNENGNFGVRTLDLSKDVDRLKRVRVIERQYRKLERCKYFVDIYEGDTRPVPESWDDERVRTFAERFQLEVIEKPMRKIRWTASADRILLFDGWSLYNRFTVVPFFPYFRRGRPFGMVRNLCSPQDTLNKATSQELHVVNTTANSGWVFESGSLVNMDADELAASGAKTGLVLEYQKGHTPPEKILPNQVPSGLAQVSAKAEVYFRVISGLPDGFLGQANRETSGTAMTQQRDGGLLQLEVVFDNLAKTRQYRAELMLELIQQFYTEERVVRITTLDKLGDPQQQDMVINETGPEGEIINDLTLGEYSVVVTSVQTHDTVLDLIFQQLREMREIGVPIPNYALIENSRMPNRKQMAEIVKKLESLAEPTEAEAEMAQMQAQLNMSILEGAAREAIAKAMEREANANLIIAQTATEQQQPLLEAQKLGVGVRQDMEKLAAQMQQLRQEAQTRMHISSEKNQTNAFVAQVQSMTKRVDFATREREKQADAAAKIDIAKLKPKPKPAAKK